MNEEEYQKLERSTKLEWYINLFIHELENSFLESGYYDEALERYISDCFEKMSEEEEKYLKKEMGVN